MNLKNFLKSIKTNESTISVILGGLVVIIVGILTVNYFKDRNASLMNDALSTDSVKEHVVEKGESLWSIAEDYYGSGYNWVDLAEANNLTDYNLEIGQNLTIPEIAVKEPTATMTDDTTMAMKDDTQSISGDSYTVVKGDNLWDIAVRAYGDGYKWVEIAKANKLDNPNIIHSGNVLVLPR